MNVESRAGIIGAGGKIGSRIASRFLDVGGYEVHVHNRALEKLSGLEQRGAIIAAIPREAAQRSKVVFHITDTDESSVAVCEGEEGIFAGMGSNQIFVELATLSLERVKEEQGECTQKGIPLLIAPFTGGIAAAESGKMTIWAAGRPDVLEEARPYLSVISQKVIYVGEDVESVVLIKLSFNAKRAADMVMHGDIRELATQMGVDRKIVGETFIELDGGVAPRAYQDYNEEEVVGFTIESALKDLLYFQKLVGNTRKPWLDATIDAFRRQVMIGNGLKDWTFVARGI